MKTVHQLKVSYENWQKYTKPESWSIRNNVDRNFKIGDYCEFQCTSNENMSGLKHSIIFKEIIAILKGIDFNEGLRNDYCILTLKMIHVIEYEDRR